MNKKQAQAKRNADAMLVNQALKLRRDEPVNNPEDAMNWRCDIWEEDSVRSWPLFATAWGHSRTEAMSKANSIIAACAINRETEI